MKTGWSRVWQAALLCSVLAFVRVAVADEDPASLPFRIAVVNLVTILDQAPQSAAASKTLEETFSERESALNQEQLGLEQAQDAFRNAVDTLSQNQRIQRERELRTMRREYSRKLEDLNEEIRVAKDTALEGVQDQVEKAVEAVRAREQIDVVLRESDYLVASKRADITDKVLAYLQQQFETSAKKPQEQAVSGE